MAEDSRDGAVDEETHLLGHLTQRGARPGRAAQEKAVRPRYHDYAAIDWRHGLHKKENKLGHKSKRSSIRNVVYDTLDSSTGWIAAAVIGTLTACVAFVVDVSVVTVADWKFGYCTTNPLLGRKSCCSKAESLADCKDFKDWTSSWWTKYAIYIGFVLLYGTISSSATALTKGELHLSTPDQSGEDGKLDYGSKSVPTSKVIYRAAGSGIPEIRTILSGFVINDYLNLKVMFVKSFGAIFAVPTGMCLGKEGPFVHISGCIGHAVASRIPKYRHNERKIRELLSAACAAGMTVAFGAPIGGVLFSYEEMSTYFPRRVLWRSFLCALFAGVVLKQLDPTGTGRLILFETNFRTSYLPVHYLIFVGLGIVGGIWGGLFCKLNFLWSKWFRSFPIIKKYSIFETFLICAVTAITQFPNPLTRETGDIVIKQLLVDCKDATSEALNGPVCSMEAGSIEPWKYKAWLLHGMCAKLILTIITFGVRVPSGVIIPALDGGAFFGRLVGQWVGSAQISPGTFAMVGASAFLAGVSRMSVSLAVIMIELTGELEYVVPHMIGIFVAKWVADLFIKEGVYDIGQMVLGHPFLDIDEAMRTVRELDLHNRVADLGPSQGLLEDITIIVPASNKVSMQIIEGKLQRLKAHGLLDIGFLLVRPQLDHPDDWLGSHNHGRGTLMGYIAQSDLEFGLVSAHEVSKTLDVLEIRFLGTAAEGDFDLGMYVDRAPPVISANASLEHAVDMFGKLGISYLCSIDEDTGGVVGWVTKRRLVAFIESQKDSA